LQESKERSIGEIKQLGRQNKQLLNENANLVSSCVAALSWQLAFLWVSLRHALGGGILHSWLHCSFHKT